MVSNPAVGIDSTEARTRVLTLPVDTGLVSGTVVVDLTLRPAVGRRSQHLRQTVTLTPGPDHPRRFAVWSTGVRLAGVHGHHRLHRLWWSSTGHKWIPNISLVTDTDWDMIGHLTVGIGATETWAGINTVEVPALLASWAVRVDDTLRSAGNVGVAKVVRDALTGTS